MEVYLANYPDSSANFALKVGKSLIIAKTAILVIIKETQMDNIKVIKIRTFLD